MVVSSLGQAGDAPVTRHYGVVYDTGRSMGPLSMTWRPGYTSALMHQEPDIIRDGLRAKAVLLGGRPPAAAWIAKSDMLLR
jgi:hypothetical protein